MCMCEESIRFLIVQGYSKLPRPLERKKRKHAEKLRLFVKNRKFDKEFFIPKIYLLRIYDSTI